MQAEETTGVNTLVQQQRHDHNTDTVVLNERERDDNESKQRTPLPVWQLFSVYLIQLAEPLTALCIYPFINQFVRDTGITGGDEKKTGYYGGIIESTFFLSEALTVVPWGYLSDQYGRRPILLIAPLGLAIAMMSFGLSTTFWPLVVARAFQGIFNGNIGVGKSVIAELTDSTNRADAYAFIPLVWSIGSTTAPFIGGLLSKPEQRWPDGIGRIGLLKQHPYFLPCAVSGGLSFLAFITAYLLLKETLPSAVAKENEKKQKNPKSISDDVEIPTERTPLITHEYPASPIRRSTSSASLAITQTPSSPPAPIIPSTPPRFLDAFTRPILFSIFASGFLAFIDMCHFALLPLMWSTPIPLGGLALPPHRIGLILGSFGICNAFIQINFAGKVLRRWGVRSVFRVCVGSVGVCFVMYPCMKWVVMRRGEVDWAVGCLIAMQLACHPLIYFAYGAIQVLIVDSVPPGGPIGTANGLAQMVSSGSRTLAPSLATSLFSLSLQKNLAGGNLVYYFFIVFTVLGTYLTGYLPKMKGGIEERSGEEDKIGVET